MARSRREAASVAVTLSSLSSGKPTMNGKMPAMLWSRIIPAVWNTCSIVMSLRMRFSISFEPDSTPTSSRRNPDCLHRTHVSSGKRTPLTHGDLDEILERANRRPDGTYRTAAGRLLPGKVLGGFTVGDNARVGSNAVVLKPVPPGATAVGNPARIIQAEAEADATREATAAKMGFSAYGLTQGDDPLSQAMKGLIDNASGHEHQIALLWQAIEKLSARSRELPSEDCVPGEAHTTETFDAERLARLVK